MNPQWSELTGRLKNMRTINICDSEYKASLAQKENFQFTKFEQKVNIRKISIRMSMEPVWVFIELDWTKIG